MPRAKGNAGSKGAESYKHEDKTRKNIPEAGQVDYIPKTDGEKGKTSYCWDPRESPQLVWAGKAGLKKLEVEEQASIEVPLVNLHIHERVSTEAILRSVQRKDAQRSLFADPEMDFNKEVQFYQHDVNWSNRMILGDSLLVMNSLLEREGMRGSVQCIYMDPPYGIKYASNFQPRIDQRDVKDGKDEDLTREVLQVQAFRDTWELGVHSYLSYMRDRLLLARELLRDEGSIFVQIGDENVHRVRCLMDEVFGEENFCSLISFRKTGGATAEILSTTVDHIVWYARDKQRVKYRQVYSYKKLGDPGTDEYDNLELEDGSERPLTEEEVAGLLSLPRDARVFTTASVVSDGFRTNTSVAFEYKDFRFNISPDKNWKTSIEGMKRLCGAGRIYFRPGHRIYKRYLQDFPATELNNVWFDVRGALNRAYAVQTSHRVVERCILMTTDPGDLVLDPTCGSGTTAYVAEQWGRRWITMDTSRVALSIARHRLMTASFDYYRLRFPTSGVAGGFKYKTVPHITLKSIAQNPEIDRIAEEFQPQIDEALRGYNTMHVPEGYVPLKEWEVPRLTAEQQKRADSGYNYQVGSNADMREGALVDFWRLKREMQARIDASIARNAPTEELVDQPEKESGIVRVSGPFTVEAVPNVSAEMGIGVEEKVLGNALHVQVFEPVPLALAAVEAQNVSAYLSDMIEKLRKTGVVAKNGRKLAFSNLRPLDHAVLHAEGETADGDGKRVAVLFGPQNGAISESHVKEALASGRRYDVLLLCGYDFTPTAQEMAQAASQPDWQVLLAYVAPDTVMTDLLKDTKASQLFTMVGEPDVVVYRHGDPSLSELAEDATRRGVKDVAERAAALQPGEMFLELRGVDVYDPLSGEVRSDAGENVHAVFIDQDYDGKSFCICQALFPNKKDSWAKIARNLGGTIDEEAFSAFRTLVSLPFKPGSSFDKETGEGRVHVKVIDQRGNAVVKTVRV